MSRPPASSEDAHRAFWTTVFADFPWTRSALLRPVPLGAPARRHCVLTVGVEEIGRWTAAAELCGATLVDLVRAAWAVVLGRYAESDQVLVGVRIEGRVLPLRVSLAERSVRVLMQEIRARNDQLLPHAAVSASLLRDVANTAPGQEPIESTVDAGSEDVLDLPLVLQVLAPEGQLALWHESSLIQSEQAELVLRLVAELCAAMAHDLGQPVAALPRLSAEEQHLVAQANATRSGDVLDGSGYALISEQVARQPDVVAIESGTTTLTYRELDQRVERLARRLRALGVGLEQVVALASSQVVSIEVGIAGLAVIRAGGVVSSLLLEDPVALNQVRLRELAPTFVLVSTRDRPRVTDFGVPVRVIEEEVEIAGTDPALPALGKEPPGEAAFVIQFTSGTTGRPKAVVATHRMCRNATLTERREVAAAQRADGRVGAIERRFDSTMPGMLRGLGAGQTLVLPGSLRGASADAWRIWLVETKITRAALPPALLELIPAVAYPALRDISVGSSQLMPAVVRPWLPIVRITNRYRSTEASAGTSVICDASYLDDPTIGAPIADARIYLLDDDQRPVNFGVPGEIHIGGPVIARGYFGDPVRTASRFLPDPFAEAAGQRMYETGDFARARPGGAFVFVGRRDGQVKIRGFRVELGQVQNALLEHADIHSAVVIGHAFSPTDLRLVAYVVPRDRDAAPTPQALRLFLRERLPEYMVPAVFVTLERIPLLRGQKPDLRALPRPVLSVDPERPYKKPREGVETTVAELAASLLSQEGVGADDDFFELGAHSLIAMQLVSRLSETLGVELHARDVFETPTASGLARRIEVIKRSGQAKSNVPPLVRVDRNGELVLSFAQERLWFIDQLEPGSSAYNLPMAVRLKGALDTEALFRALDELVRRHEVLRTRFETTDGRARQVIEPALSLAISVQDLRPFPPEAQAAEVRAEVKAEGARPFDLAMGPLVRARLLMLSVDEHVALFTMHHIVSDGWSMDVLVREVAALYGAFHGGQPSPLPPLPIQYADYAAWQRDWLRRGELERQVDYWKRKLDGLPPVLPLPTDRPRPPVQRHVGRSLPFAVSRELTKSLVELGRARGASLFMTMLGAFQVLLARYTGQMDIAVGTPIANRTHSETEKLIGFFVNTLVMRTQLDPDETFESLLQRVRQTALDAYAHQDVPFGKVVDALSPERRLSHSPLFQVMLVLQNVPLSRFVLPELVLEGVAVESESAQFDLKLTLTEVDGALAGKLEYDSDLFEGDSMTQLLGHYERLLEGIARQPGALAMHLPLLSEAEQRKQLVAWNDTARAYPKDTLIHDLFVEQARRTPKVVALRFEGTELTYGELDERTNQLGRHLQKRGVGPDVLVGICVERSLEMVVGLLGILKAGGAYVPLDPGYPKDRLAYMIGDSAAKLLLTQARLLSELPEHGAEVLCLDRDWEQIGKESKRAPRCAARAEHLAYMIYTSGSTGRPKGAMNRHGGIWNRLQWMQEQYQLTAKDVVLQKTPFSFDVSVWEFFWPLMFGARLVIARVGGHQDPEYLAEEIAREGVTTLHFVPPMLAAFVEAPALESRCRSVRQVMCSGEALPYESQERLFGRLRATKLHNLYGPTEAAVDVTYHECERDGANRVVPIGRPVTNTQMHVLDARAQLVARGVAGELHIAGVQLGRGYWNRPELTADRFVPSPFGVGERMYRTGDLARWLADGNLEYLGRIDHQVKIRGFRIELGEIEAALCEQAGVREAVVLAREDVPGQKRLVAYLTGEVEIGSLKEALSATLPDYMAPSAFVVLEAMPLTPNGKIDRKVLPSPSFEGDEAAYVAPRDEVEAKLAAIWKALLRIERVGIDDNFFELGGDSILAIQVLSRARQAGVDLSPKQLFEQQTVRRLAQVAGAIRRIEAPQEMVVGEMPLLPIQRWFLEKDPAQAAHHNQALLLQAKRALSPQLLDGAMHALQVHHDALRARFSRGPRGWTQRIVADVAAGSFRQVDVSAEVDPRRAIEAAAQQAQESLDLERGPLLRAVLFEPMKGSPQRLLIAIHHLVVDGVSWRVLLEDLQLAYDQLERGEIVSLPAKTSSYAAWGRRLIEYAASETLRRELSYWTQQADPEALPVDHQLEGSDRAGNTRSEEIGLTAEETGALLRELPAVYRTQMNDALLTALLKAFAGWTGTRQLTVALEGHGREDLFADLDVSRTVGWFTSLFPVELHLGEERDPGEELMAIKEQLRAVPRRGVGYGVLRYLARAEGLGDRREPSVLFNYLGQRDAAVDRGWFEAAAESSGIGTGANNPRGPLIEVDASVTDGRLQARFSYSKARHERSTVVRLAQGFATALRELVAHCAKPDAGGFTSSDFEAARISKRDLGSVLAHFPPREVEDVYELSALQQGLLYETLLQPDSGVYVIQLAPLLLGKLDEDAFERAWRALAQRHAVFRTAFLWDGLASPQQVVLRNVVLPFDRQDWRGLDDAQQAAQFDGYLVEDRRRGFSPNEAPLARVALLRLGDEKYRLVWTHHHLLNDGWGNAYVLQELLTTYEAFRARRSLELGPARPYRDYIAWVQAQDHSKEEAHWRTQLRGLAAPTPLPHDGTRRAAPSEYDGPRHVALPASTTSRLQALARTQHITLNTIVQGAWALLLSRYSGEHEVLFGSTVSGRPAELAGVETMVGLFINTLPVRVQIRPDEDLSAWLTGLHQSQLEQRQHEHCALVQIQGWSDVPRGTPLFESLVVFENYPLDESLKRQSGSLRFEDIRGVERPHYPLTLIVVPGAELRIKLDYQATRFGASFIDGLLASYATLLGEIAAGPRRHVDELSLLTEHQRQQQLTEWNEPGRRYPQDRLLHELFVDQAKRTPEAVALRCEGEQLSYRELDERTNQLARYLRRRGVGPEVLVGICVERSLEMVVGLLGILKAGGAYVPLDPAYPRERLEYTLADSGTSHFLTQERLLAILPSQQATAVCLDRDWSAIEHEPRDALPSAARPASRAYVIYTSGSTGRPKGVQVTHDNVTRLLEATAAWYRFDGGDVWTMFHSYAFDFSVWEMWGALAYGGRLIVVPHWVARDTSELHALLVRERVTVLNQTPSAFYALIRADERADASAKLALRYVIFGGEALELRALGPWYDQHPDDQPRLINMYGITETTVHVSYRALTKRDAAEATGSLIGRGIPDLQLYLRDPAGNLIPVGAAGEIYVGGAGLARGYLGKSELTAERFVPSPFGVGERLYRTGDSARWLPDGNLEYLGRIDQQVKIRGFRIELGEIEAALSEQAGVRESVVLAREDTPGDKRLVAYLTGVVEIVALKEALAARLPEYMVPSAFVALEAMPLTANGKIDRKALPAPDLEADRHGRYVAPRTATEEVIATLWASVLGVDRVGAEDSFFDLGGHSLLATQVMSRIRDAFAVELPLRSLFDAPSVAALGRRVDEARRGSAHEPAAPPLVARARTEAQPISYAQERLWFIDQLEPGSSAYNIFSALRLHGLLDVEALARALDEVTRRHDSLRARFETAAGHPLQVIEPLLPMLLSIEDLQHLSNEDREAELRARAHAEAARPFDLARGPLVRARLLALASNDHALLFTMHHIVSDGWSMGVLIGEVARLYHAFHAGQASPLPELPIQYADYAAWQRDWLGRGELERQLGYWKTQLGGSSPVLALPTDRPRPGVQRHVGRSVPFAVPRDLTDALLDLGRAQGCTLFMTLLAAFQVLLARYSGQRDVSVGVPIANRTRSDTEGIIGLFVNTLVLRTSVHPDATFEELVKTVRRTTLDAYAHQDVPFERVVTVLSPVRSLSHAPLFQVMLALQNAPTSAVSLPELMIEGVELESESSKFDLALSLTETDGGIAGKLEYDSDLFDAETVERLLGSFTVLLRAIAEAPTRKVGALPLLTPADRARQLGDWNDTTRAYPVDRLVHTRFSQQSARTPEAVAVRAGRSALSYRELESRSNQLARYLQQQGVGPDVLVGICVERSLEMVVGLLGILKAGGAYVPLDPEYPQERLAHMLRDSEASLLLTTAALLDGLPQHDATTVCLDRDWERIAEESVAAPIERTRPQNLAYVIFTSGSTGRPKGAALTHAALHNHMMWMQDAYPLSPVDRVLQKTAFGFDASVWEFWAPLLVGAQLVMAGPGEHRDVRRMLQLVAEHEVTTLQLVPSVLALMVDEPSFIEHTRGLRRLFCGGEALSEELTARVQRLTTAELVNLYGPTEVCIDTLSLSVRDRVSLGRPIANVRAHVLDDGRRLLPTGVGGELHLSGTGLGRGYLGRPDLTAEMFVPDPNGACGARTYRTGDLVRWLPEGTIEYLGRMDHQVKIRGFRIELGEIEAALRAQPGVRDVVVVAREDVPGQKRLVGYVVGEVEGEALKGALSVTLPEYMVPAAMVVLGALPLTPNGKVDRKALPAPEFGGDEATHVAPRNEVEEKLAGIWKELLRVERVGVRDNFFELGGDSILSIQVVSRARTAGLELSPKQLFEHPTVEGLARVAGSRERVEAEQGLVVGEVALSPIEALFFEHGEGEEASHFNQAVMLKVEGTLDEGALRAALTALGRQHDALRLRYRQGADGWKKALSEGTEIELERSDLSKLGEEEQRRSLEEEANKQQRSLDLVNGPLIRAAVYELGARGKRLLVVIHHVAVDGVSWRVLLGDLERGYEQALRGRDIELGKKTTSVRVWGERLSSWAQSEAVERELAYWRKRDGGERLPTEREGPNLASGAETVVVELEEAETEALLREVPPVYRTQVNDALLLAVAEAFESWTGSSKLQVNLEGHGREELFGDVDLSRTVGWFTSLYPVALDLTSATGAGERLKAVKEQLRGVPNRGVGYGALKYLGRREVRAELRAQASPEVSFNYLGQLDQALERGSIFEGAKESVGVTQSGKRVRDHLIDINARVSGGRLSVALTYNARLQRKETIEGIGARLRESLRGVIAHCRTPGAGGYTPSDFPLAKVEQGWLDREAGADVEDVYALSPMQEGMLFVALLEPESEAYFEQVSVRLEGALRAEMLERAWRSTVERHEILRTSFHWQGLKRPVQVVRRTVAFAVERISLEGKDEETQDEALEAFERADRKRGFTLSKAPLLRAALVKLSEEEHVLVWSFHHLLLDGWCMPILMKEVLGHYEAQVSGRRFEEKAAPRYRNYIAWLAEQDEVEAERYFRGMLSGFEAPTSLGVARGRVGAQPRQVAELTQRLSAVTTQRLKGAASKLGLTLNTLVQGAWALLLARYSGTKDVVFGAVGSGRPAELDGVEEMVGLFINTLPVRVQIGEEATVAQVLGTLQQQQVETRRYEASPLAKVQGWSEVARGQPLFESLFVFENYPLEEALQERQGGGRRLRVAQVEGFEQTNYALTVVVLPGAELGLRVQYDAERFDEATAKRLIEHYERLLEEVAKTSETPALRLPMLSEAEQQQQLVAWNDTARVYPRDKLIHELFSEQAKKNPDAIAVVYEGRSLSYRELDERSNQLAMQLQQRGVGPDTLVGICVERSLEVVVGLLGILKAGGAYLPLDPSYPKERLAYMMETARASVLVVHSKQRGLLSTFGGRVIVLDEVVWSDEGAAPTPQTIRAQNIAYVDFTSGSTGEPKGVCVPHQAVVRLVQNTNFAEMGPEEVFLLMAPLHFDASTLELWGPLCNGGRLIVYPAGLPTLDELAAVLARERVSTLWLTAGLFHQMVDRHPQALAGVHQILAGGDVLSSAHVADVVRRLRPGNVLINGYGPTENTTFTCCHAMRVLPPEGASVPIGKPIANTTVYVVDERMALAVAGSAGELTTGGDGLARGYLDRPELTAERFVPNPFGRPGARFYRTGDLTRWLPDGSLEYLGRIDRQVKVRGFRIELGEIEAVLGEQAGVREAVVLARQDEGGPRRLVAYLTGEASLETLKETLAARLPEYMVPAAFVVLDDMPLTPNGKIDRKALPAPSFEGDEARYVAPRNEVEAKLVAIWKEVLRVERVGVRDNFFELGGDSILSIQIVSRARDAGLELTPKQLFEHPLIEELAKAAAGGVRIEAEQGVVVGAAELLPIEGWFFEHGDEEEPSHFNQAVMLRIKDELDERALVGALQALLVQHDALRLRYRHEQDGWKKELGDVAELVLDRFDLSKLRGEEQRRALEAKATAQQRGLDLERGPVIRVALFELGASDTRLLVVIHHVAVDGVSWRVLLGDLERGYEQAKRGEAIALGAKTTSVRAWGERLSAWAKSESVERELAHWNRRRVESGVRLPRESEATNLAGTAETVVAALTEKETEALLREVPPAYRTQVNDALLLAVAEAFEGWTGSPRLQVDLEGHGREELFADADLSRTVGWFTSLYPVELDLTGARGAGARLKAIKEQLRAVPNRGIGYGALKYLGRPEVQAELKQRPSSEVSFNYLGQLDQALEPGSLFEATLDPTGLSHSEKRLRDHVIDINAQVSGGRLSMAITYNSRLQRKQTIEALGTRLVESLRALIEHVRTPEAGGYTPSDFALAKVSQDWIDQVVGRGQNVEDVYALSPMQAGMLFVALLERDSGAYFEQVSVRLVGALNVDALERAWRATIERYEILRTSFHWEDLEAPVQVVHRAPELSLERRTLVGKDEDAQRQELEVIRREDRARGFVLSKAPLMRVTLLARSPEEHELLWSFHHLLLDGWCLPLVIKEVLSAYDDYVGGRERREHGETPKYRGYIAWLAKQDQGEAERYFRALLRGFEAPTNIGIAGGRVGAQPKRVVERHTRLSAVETQRIKRSAAALGLTVNTLAQGAWALLLARYSGTTDVVFGAVGSGRPPELPGVEQMVGLFINTLPVRVRVPVDATVSEILRALQAQQVETRRYEASPLASVQTWSEVPRGQPLFESLYVFENYPLGEALQEDEGGTARLRIAATETIEQTNYALAVTLMPGAELGIRLQYDADRFSELEMERLVDHYEQLLGAIARTPEEPALRLPMLSAPEERRQLIEWNVVGRTYPRGGPIHELFSEQARKAPSAVAITYEAAHLTYRELDERSNQLAWYLQKRGVGPDVLVGLCVERSLEMVVGLLGILKAGGAYLPLDPSYPKERIEYMLADSGAPLLLTQERSLGALPTNALMRVCLDRDWEKISAESSTKPSSGVTPESLAYVIYTSGSTGKPKGVQVTHGNVTRLMRATEDWYGFGTDDVWTMFHSYAFDFSVWEIWGALVYGGRLVVVPHWVARDTAELRALLVRERVTVLNQTPSAFYALILADERADPSAKLSLRYVIFGGEALELRALGPWYERHAEDQPTLVNMYGITETTVHVTYRALAKRDVLEAAGSIIGRAIPDLQIYLRDLSGNLMPEGAVGEIYVGGTGLARGYLGKPALTAERFLPSPYGLGERLYRTGDSARWLPDGTLEYAGRIDQQVKIRGFRIELGEIETALLEQAGVREAVVMAREDVPGQRRLVGYVTGDVSMAGLKASLGGRLPEYMVPTVFVVLEAMPLTPNGKVDRRALPVPDRTTDDQERYVAPRSALEEIIAGVWAKVLRMEKVGVHDDFFALGGHSLIAAQLVSELRRTLNTEVSLRQLFDQPTVAGLAQSIGTPGSETFEDSVLLPVPRQGDIPLSFLQEAEWAGMQRAPVPDGISAAWRADGAFSPEVMTRALNEVIRRHEMLRMSIREVDGRRVQVPRPQLVVELPVVDLSGLRDGGALEVEQRVAEEADLPIDLAEDPLIRGKIWKLAERSHVILVTVHRLAFDGWSQGVLIGELVTLYAAFAKGSLSPLPELSIQYADFVHFQRRLIEGEVGRVQREYWKGVFGDGLVDLPLPFDRPAKETPEAELLSLRVPRALHDEIKTLGRREGATTFMILLMAFEVLLRRACGAEDIAVIGSIANRDRPETHPLIGTFAKGVVLRTNLADDPTAGELLRRIRQTTLDAFRHQDISLGTVLPPGTKLGVDFNYITLPANTMPTGPAVPIDLALVPVPIAGRKGWLMSDLIVTLNDDEAGINIRLDYDANRFDAATIAGMFTPLPALLRLILDEPSARIGELVKRLARA